MPNDIAQDIAQKTLLNCIVDVLHVDAGIKKGYKDSGISELFCDIFSARGIEFSTDTLFPKLSKIFVGSSHHFLLHSEEFCRELNSAIIAKKKIAIFGDYDVDGILSSYMLCDFLASVGVESKTYFSNRTLGYGIHNEIIDNIHKDGADLLIILDCGTSSHDEVEYARGLGIVSMVVDHHKIPKHHAIPDVFVNPHRGDESGVMATSMCTGGLVFFLILAYAKDYNVDFQPYNIILAMITVVCDMARLTDVNRAIVSAGLHAIRKGTVLPHFLEAMLTLKSVNKRFIDTTSIGFVVGPILNSASRMDSLEIGLKAVMSKTPEEAAANVLALDNVNVMRKKIESIAMQSIDCSTIVRKGRIVMAVSQDINSGIVGIIASRLQNSFHLPSFVLSKHKDSDVYSGSARSYVGDLSFIVHQAVEAGVLIAGGGHSAAAGFSLHADKIDAFCDLLTSYFTEVNMQYVKKVDVVVDSFSAIDPNLIKDYIYLSPFGIGFEPPVFMIKNCKINAFRKYKNRGVEILCSNKNTPHRTTKCKNFTMLDHNLDDLESAFKSNTLIDVIGTVNIDIENSRHEIFFNDVVMH